MKKSIPYYTDEELENFLNDIESDRVERKINFSKDIAHKARQAICAFANDLPGHNKPGILFIGVNDDGTPSGISVTDELLRTISDIKTDGKILPQPTIFVNKHHLKGADVAVVIVIPSDIPPVRYEGRIWVRTGPRRSVASEQEERILNEKRRYKNIPFDIYPIPSSQLSDLSRLIFENEFIPNAFKSYSYEYNMSSYKEYLSSFKMITSPDDTTPTVLGILTIGTNPQDFLPNATIQFLRIDGIDLSDDIIDEEFISGTISDQLRRIYEKIKSHNRTHIDVTSGETHKKYFSYPIAGIIQIIYNAVLHRTYEGTNTPTRVYWFNDRIEITNPGGPYGCVTCENFGQPGITDYRNPNLASIMKYFGFIQAFGRGISITRRLMQENGNPEPIFVVQPNIVMCILKERV